MNRDLNMQMHDQRRASRSWVTVTVDPINHTGTVKAIDAKALIEAAGGTRPFWNRQRRVWVTTERIAADVLAMAEAANRPVSFENVRGGGGR